MTVRENQIARPILGEYFDALYKFGDWLISENFWDTPEMVMPIITLETDRPSRAGFYDPHHTLCMGPIINLNPHAYSAKTGVDAGETLAHELVHHWQWITGRPTINNRHGVEFHERMWALYGLKTDDDTGKHYGHDERWTEIVDTMIIFKLDGFILPETPSKRRMYNHRCPGCGDSFNARTKKNVKCLACDIEYMVD